MLRGPVLPPGRAQTVERDREPPVLPAEESLQRHLPSRAQSRRQDLYRRHHPFTGGHTLTRPAESRKDVEVFWKESWGWLRSDMKNSGIMLSFIRSYSVEGLPACTGFC